MSWSDALGTAIGSAISWAVFAVCGWAWAKRKILPFWHQHKQAIKRKAMAMLYD